LFGNLLTFLSSGLLALSWWQILLAMLVMTYVTIIDVTLYLHRCLAHRARSSSGHPSFFPVLTVDDDGHIGQRVGSGAPQASREVRNG
jgi:fatty-acid desaturase